MAKDYSEDQLIQRSAAELLEKVLGWASVYAFDKEVLGVNGTLGRASYHEVLLAGRFRKALNYRKSVFFTEICLPLFALKYCTRCNVEQNFARCAI